MSGEAGTTDHALGGHLTVERATAGDAELLMAIHEDVSRWLWDRGIHQWRPGKYPRSAMEDWIAGGEAYLARMDGEPAGMIVLQAHDEFMWPGAADDALYVHGVRVLRAFAGRQVGRAMLRWAEREALTRGKRYLRLDVMADNPRIRAYYESAGFVHVRDPHDKPWPASLYEKMLSADQETRADQLVIRPALAEEVETVAAILEEAAEWLASRGINQWRMGAWLRPHIVEGIAHGEVYLAELGGTSVATLRLQWADEETWGAMPDDAGYVHGLAVRRTYGGRGIGWELLRWAEREIAAAGRIYLRLDCMARNPALRAYYERAGFAERRDIPHDEWSTLYEKRVSQP